MPREHLFLALWPDAATRTALAHCRDTWVWNAGAAIEPDQRLHLTLHFIGAVPEERVSDLASGLQVPCRPFTLCLDRAQCWPGGVAVLTPAATPRAMLWLHAALGAGLERLQFATEKRPLRPHVTLARHAIGSSAPEPMAPVPWRVRHYALVQSRPAARQYVVLRDFR